MKSVLLAAAFSLPLSAFAGDRPYRVHNGRAVVGGGGSGGRGGGFVAAGAAKAGMSAGGGSVAGAPVSYGGVGAGGQAFVGGGRRASGGHRSFYGGARRIGPGAYRVPQRVAEGGGGSGSGEGGSGEGESAPPEAPGYHKYGALIRTEGQKYQFTAPSAGERQHTVAAGEVALNEGKAYHVNRSHGLRVGPRDTPPPCTPGSNGCGSSGGSSITPNVTVVNEGDTTHNGAHDNENGGGGQGHGNPFGGGTGFDPSF